MSRSYLAITATTVFTLALAVQHGDASSIRVFDAALAAPLPTAFDNVRRASDSATTVPEQEGISWVDTFLQAWDLYESAAERGQIAALKAQLERMSQAIGAVLTLARETRVRIEQIPDEEASRRLLARVMVAIEDLETIAADPAARSSTASTHFNEIRYQSRDLSLRSVGNYAALLTSMPTEFRLADLLGVAPDQRRELGSFYSRYFSRAIDAVAEQNAEQAKLVKAYADRLAAVPKQADGSIVCFAGTDTGCSGDNRCTWDFFQGVTGDPTKGYSFSGKQWSANRRNCSRSTACGYEPGGVGRGRGGTTAAVRENMTPAPPLPEATPVEAIAIETTSCPASLNDTANNLKVATARQRALTLAETTLRAALADVDRLTQRR